MNLVVGATGMLGAEVCRLLTQDGKPVRAMVRNAFDQDKSRKLREEGVQIVQGDLRNKKTFAAALTGVSHVIATASAMPSSYVPEQNDIHQVDKNGMMDLIDVAVEKGVKHFIYTSFSGNISEDFPLRNAKRTVEQHLRNSKMTFTILRPGFFSEIWLSSAMGFDVPKGRIQIFGTGSKPVSFISYRDVALFAVKSIANPFARNLILELGGPEKLSQLEVAKLFEKFSGRKFSYQNFPEEKIRMKMNSTLDPMQKSIYGLMLSMAEGDPIDMDNTLKAFHFKLRSIRDLDQRRVHAE